MNILNRIRIKQVCLVTIFTFMMGCLFAFNLHQASLNQFDVPNLDLQNQDPSVLKDSQSPPTLFNGIIRNITREIKIDSDGIFFTKDEVVFLNDGTDPIQTFYVCMNLTISEDLEDMVVTRNDGTLLPYSRLPNLINGYVTWKITFPNALHSNQKMKFSIYQYFGRVYEVDASNASKIYVEFDHYLYTLSPYVTGTMEVSVGRLFDTFVDEYYPTYGTEQEQNINADIPPRISYTTYNASPFLDEWFFIKFHGSQIKLAETESAKINLIPNNYVDWRVISELRIKNLARAPISALNLIIPADAKNVKVYDDIGEILGLTEPDESSITGETKVVELDLQINRYSLLFGDAISFKIEYSLPSGSRIQAGDETNILFIDMFNLIRTDWPMNDLEIRIALPAATNIDYKKMNMLPDAIDNIEGTIYLIFERDFAGPLTSSTLVLTYQYSIFSMQSRALFISMVVGIAISAAIIIRKTQMKHVRRSSGVEVERELPAEELKEFTRLFEEKVALYIEIDNLNENLKRRKVKKREYSKIISDLSNRIRQVDSDIQY